MGPAGTRPSLPTSLGPHTFTRHRSHNLLPKGPRAGRGGPSKVLQGTGLRPTLPCPHKRLEYPGDPSRGTGQDLTELQVPEPQQERNTQSLTLQASILAREVEAPQEGDSKGPDGQVGRQRRTGLGYAESRAEHPRGWGERGFCRGPEVGSTWTRGG